MAGIDWPVCESLISAAWIVERHAAETCCWTTARRDFRRLVRRGSLFREERRTSMPGGSRDDRARFGGGLTPADLLSSISSGRVSSSILRASAREVYAFHSSRVRPTGPRLPIFGVHPTGPPSDLRASTRQVRAFRSSRVHPTGPRLPSSRVRPRSTLPGLHGQAPRSASSPSSAGSSRRRSDAERRGPRRS